jgi:transposase, IS30 family
VGRGQIDRRSRFFLALHIPVRTKTATAKAVIGMLKAQTGRTLTLDNGVESADHKRIEEPYASWQRGSNENANGRLRHWIPRSADLRNLAAQKLLRIVERINEQP